MITNPYEQGLDDALWRPRRPRRRSPLLALLAVLIGH